MGRAVLLALVAVIGNGCASTRSVRLYNLDTGNTLIASFRGSPWSTHGPAWIGPTQRTAECRGEYDMVASGTTAWGHIYAGGAVASGTATTSDNHQRGSAVVTCQLGLVIECEFIASGRRGNGACRDNLSRRYRLMF